MAFPFPHCSLTVKETSPDRVRSMVQMHYEICGPGTRVRFLHFPEVYIYLDRISLCYTNSGRVSSRDFNMVARRHEQPDTPGLQDRKLANLYRSAQTPERAADLARSRDALGTAPTGRRDRQQSHQNAATQTSGSMKVFQQGAAGFEVYGPRLAATKQRIPLPVPRRKKVALCEASGPAVDSARFRSPDRKRCIWPPTVGLSEIPPLSYFGAMRQYSGFDTTHLQPNTVVAN